jgi:hypothetical protein
MHIFDAEGGIILHFEKKGEREKFVEGARWGGWYKKTSKGEEPRIIIIG